MVTLFAPGYRLTHILKSDDYINDHPNDNGPNSKLKALYNNFKAKWMMKYGTMGFQPRHMNSVLVETWESFVGIAYVWDLSVRD